jgi:hypothetical protein
LHLSQANGVNFVGCVRSARVVLLEERAGHENVFEATLEDFGSIWNAPEC